MNDYNNNNGGRNDYRHATGPHGHGARPPISMPVALNSPFAANVANNDPLYSCVVDPSTREIVYPGVFLGHDQIELSGGYGGPPSGGGYSPRSQPSPPHGRSSGEHTNYTMIDGRWDVDNRMIYYVACRNSGQVVNDSYPQNSRSGGQRGYRSTQERSESRRGGSITNHSGDVHVPTVIRSGNIRQNSQSRSPEAQAHSVRHRKSRIKRQLLSDYYDYVCLYFFCFLRIHLLNWLYMIFLAHKMNIYVHVV